MRPDNINTSCESIEPPKKEVPPTIIFAISALKKMKALIDLHSTEVAWLGTLVKRDENTYYIGDIYYPKHSEMTGTTCTISEKGITRLGGQLMREGHRDKVTQLMFWGHSHVNMPTGPSGQDEEESFDILKAFKKTLVRAICNKSGEISVSVFDWDRKLRFDHIKWQFEDDTNSEFLNKKIEKIRETLDNAQDPIAEKLENIKEIIAEDSEMEEIIEEFKRLQPLNKPDESDRKELEKAERKHRKTANKNKKGGDQENLFGLHRGKRSRKRPDGESIDISQIPPDELPDDVDYPYHMENEPGVDQVMNDWELRHGGH